LLAALRVRGENGSDPHRFLETYARGLAAGVDPDHAQRWPRIRERRQATVEAASIAIALSETRPWLWDRLDETVQSRVIDWLADIVGTSGYRNNWLWFQTVVESFLREVGGPWDQSDLDSNAQLVEDLYAGQGWYSDGRGLRGEAQTFDYYTGWAWHVYPLMDARIRGVELEAGYRERLHAYLDQARWLIGSTGAPALLGRSATYRWAVLAPFWAGALAGATPLEPHETRATADAVLHHFLDDGSVDDDGMLRIGWHGEFLPVRQPYSGSGSPYWASKGFLGLLLPQDHPVWSDAHETAQKPIMQARTIAMAAPGWLVTATPRDGIVRVVNHGSDRMHESGSEPHADDPFYRRLGYSNITSPQLSRDAIAAPIESHVALLDASGSPSHRDGIERLRMRERQAMSRSHVHWLDTPDTAATSSIAAWAGARRGPILTVVSVVNGIHEVRLAWWSPLPTSTPGLEEPAELGAAAVWPEDPGPWRFRFGGWPLPADDVTDIRVTQDDESVTLRRRDGVTSVVRGLVNLDASDTVIRTNSDPFARHSITPTLHARRAATPGLLTAALVVLTGDRSEADPEAVSSITADGRTVSIRWRDDNVDEVQTDQAVHL
jgi:hypothetical protein